MSRGLPRSSTARSRRRAPRRKRSAEPNILTRTIAEELVERLAFVNRRFEHVPADRGGAARPLPRASRRADR